MRKKITTGGDMQTKMDFFVPISKLNEEERMVYGVATCSKLDNQNEIVDYEATKEALKDYSQWRNIREMHKPSAVGTAPVLELRDGSQELYIGAKIVDEAAWEKCKEGVYKGFSIGGEVLDRKIELDKASGKPVNRVTKYMLNEISVVDRPANPNCRFQTVKRDTSVHIVTVSDDPLKTESARVMEKALVLAKRTLTREELEGLPDEDFGLIKVTADGDTLIKHRSYPMPDRTHAINMIRKMVGCDELTHIDKERIHDTALAVLGKKHKERECPYCIEQGLKGGVAVKKMKKFKKQTVTVTDEPEKKTVTVDNGAPADSIDDKATVDANLSDQKAPNKAPITVGDTPAENQKNIDTIAGTGVDDEPFEVGAGVPPNAKEEATDEEAPSPIDVKLDRIITLLESVMGMEEAEGDEEAEIELEEVDEEGELEDDEMDEEGEVEDEEMDEEGEVEDEEMDEEGEVKDEEMDEEGDVEDKDMDEEGDSDLKPAIEVEDEKAEKMGKRLKFKLKKAGSTHSNKLLKRLQSRVKAIVEPIAKENRLLRRKIEKMEKQPLPRKGALSKSQKAEKIEKYQEMSLEKSEITFSKSLRKDIAKASDMRKSGKALSADESTFCQRVAERMLEEKLSR